MLLWSDSEDILSERIYIGICSMLFCVRKKRICIVLFSEINN